MSDSGSKIHEWWGYLIIFIILLVCLKNSSREVPNRNELIQQTGMISQGAYNSSHKGFGQISIVIERNKIKKAYLFDYLNFTHNKLSNCELLNNLKGMPVNILYSIDTNKFSDGTEFETLHLWEVVPLTGVGGFTYQSQKEDVFDNNKFAWVIRVLLVLYVIYILYRIFKK